MKIATATEVARRFGEILMEVKHGREPLRITKNGVPMAELRPVPGDFSLAAFVELWRETEIESDDAFARDLARINRGDRPPENPWD